MCNVPLYLCETIIQIDMAIILVSFKTMYCMCIYAELNYITCKKLAIFSYKLHFIFNYYFNL